MKYGSPNVTITLDDSAGVPRVVTSFVLTMGALKITNLTQVSTAYGDSWFKELQTGIRKGTPIGLTGILDDTPNTGTFATMTVTDADAVPGFTRTLAVGLGGGHVFTAEVILAESSVVPKSNNLTDFAATLNPTGTITQT